jgi:hypothetical protein
MKYTQVFLVTVLALIALSSSTKVQRRHAALEGLFSFSLGCLDSLSEGGSSAVLKECIPAPWKKYVNTTSSPNTSLGGNMQGPLKQIMGILGSALSVACKFKSKIISFLQGKLKFRRYFLIFAENGRFKKSFWKKLKKGVSNVGKKIGNAAKAVGSAVSNAVNFIGKTFTKIVTAIKNIRSQIINFFHSETWKNIKSLFMCIVNNRGNIAKSAKKVVANVKGFIAAVGKLSTPAGIVEVLVNCICNWRKFKKAIEYFIDFLKSNGSKKWNRLGAFLGQLAVAIGSS